MEVIMGSRPAHSMDRSITAQDGVKRKRASPEEEDNDEGRKRGRPRVDPQSQSAADRRRTQIRLAQRAYRQRKESTLDELRKQVTDLQDTIKTMNQSFQEFYGKCVSQDSMIPSHLLGEMRLLLDQYTNLAHRNFESSEGSPPSTVAEVERRLSAVNVSHAVRRHAQQENPTDQVVNAACGSNSVWGYTLEHGVDQISPPQIQHSTSFDNTTSTTTNSVAAPPNVDLHRPLSHNMSLGLPFTYAFRETTFARRVHRASAELAYRLSCDSSRNPAKFDQIFDLWLKWAPNIKFVQDQLRNVLYKDTTESLSLWHFPLSHIGGAGTHYARQEVHGGPWHPKPGSDDWNIRLTSAPTMVPGTDEAERYDSQRAMLEVIATHPEYQGEWFDAYDVEGYLAEKGINVDPQSSFADIEMPLSEVIKSEEAELRRNPSAMISTRISAPSSTSSVSGVNGSVGSSGPRTNSIHTASTTPPSVNAFDNDFDTFSNMGFLNSGVGYSGTNTGSFVNMMPLASQPYISERSTAAVSDFGLEHAYSSAMYQTAQLSMPQVPQKRVVTIDLAKLVLAIARSALCLGRTPGYRRHKIDSALRDSIMHDV